jgi:VWFA-related protein
MGTVKKRLIAAGLILTSGILLAATKNPVSLQVTVTDDLGRLVTSLPPEAFQVFEDKVPQPIVSLTRDDTPLSIGIVFDTSASMGSSLEESRAAVADFFKTANPEDEAFLVEFSDRPTIAAAMTHDFKEIENRLTNAAPAGRTALLDGIYLALDTLKTAHNSRKALLVISDGRDNSSRYKATEVANLIQESGVPVYTIGVLPGGGRAPEETSGAALLRYLSEPTGGRSFIAANRIELQDAAAKIGIELRNQYVIAYNPTNPAHNGRYRKIAVRIVSERGMHAFSRTGYFAPTQ